MKLDGIRPGQTLSGIEPAGVVSVVSVTALGESAVQVIYRRGQGGIGERLVSADEAAGIAVAASGLPFSFQADGAAFQLACEARRMDLAYLFDPMMAVHTSNLEPLPHQITAVYDALLPR